MRCLQGLLEMSEGDGDAGGGILRFDVCIDCVGSRSDFASLVVLLYNAVEDVGRGEG